MRDLAEELLDLCRGGRRFVLATVVGVQGSAPRPLGATMAVTEDGEAIGSISGGCVEGAVYDIAGDVLRGGGPTIETYGISDDDAFAVGLTCGGVLDVLVHEPDPALLAPLLDRLGRHGSVALATVLSGPARLGAQLTVDAEATDGGFGGEDLDAAVTKDARGMLEAGMTGVRHFGPRGERLEEEIAVLIQAFTPPPRMLVFGATDFASAVARMGVFLGHRVTVCDARPVFATRRRFPEADEVVSRWPDDYLREELAGDRVDARTVIVVLTHDPKFDVPLLQVALPSPAGYVGAMGSRRTHHDRLRRLREAGVPDHLLARLRSPIGLDLGGRTAEETAVSIAAEIVQLRWGSSGRPLTTTDGDIHAPVGVRV